MEQARAQREPVGRARGYEELYAAHAPGLRRHCLRLTGDAHTADDLLQEVFVRFMARFPEPPADMHVAGYLYATARNVLWKQLRDDHEVADGEIESSVGADDDLEIDPERAALLVEQRSLVQRCSAVLTGRQRRALTLREVEGHSYAEIGDDLGIGTDAVAQVISRARVRLRVAVRRAHVDLDQLTPECRAMLGPLSDYLDSRAAESSPEIEAHLAECETCRQTLVAFQGAGSRLRGSLPLAPIAGILARVGEAVRLGGSAPADAVRAGAVVVAAALAIGGGGALVVAHEMAAPPHAPSAVAQQQHPKGTVEIGGHGPRVTPTAPASPQVQGTSASTPAGGRATVTPWSGGHPSTQGTVSRTPGSRPVSPSTPGAAPAATPVEPPATHPVGTTPAVTPKPPTRHAPVVTPPVAPKAVVTPTVERVTTQVGSKVVAPVSNKVVAPVVDKVLAPVVKKVVAPVVDKVVNPIAKQIVVPVTAPVTKALAPVTEPVTEAVAPVTAPVTRAVAPVVDPVTKVVAPVVDPVTSVVNTVLPPADPAAGSSPTPPVKLPAIQIGGIKVGG